MKRKSKILSLVFILAISCNEASVFTDPHSYMDYMKDHQPKEETVLTGIHYLAEMIPPEMAMIQNRNMENANAYNNILAFKMSLTDTATGKSLLNSLKNNEQVFGAVLNYLNNEMPANIWLMADGDSIKCLYAQLQRGYGVSPEDPVMVGFQLQKDFRKYANLDLLYFDALLAKEKIVFEFERGAYAHLPYLSTEK